MPKLLQGYTWLTWNELQAYGISKHTIDWGTRKGNYSWIQTVCPETSRKLIRLDTIPAATRAKLPSEAELVAELKESARERAASGEQLQATLHQLAGGALLGMLNLDPSEILRLQQEGFAPEQAGKIGRLAAWLRLADNINRKQWEKLGLTGKQSALQAIIKGMAQEYADGLLAGRAISNLDVLYRKLKAFRAEGVDALVHGNTGNEYPKKLSDEHAHALLKAYRDLKKVSKWHAYEKYRTLVVSKGETPVSYSAAKAFLHQNHIELAAALARYNKRVISSHYTPHIHRARPTYSLDLVTGDGVPVSETVIFPKGHFLLDPKVQKDKPGQLNLWCWYDTTSEAVLGWSVARAPEEPFEMVRSSFRDIAKLHGRMPIEVSLDQNKAQNKLIKGMMAAAGVTCFEKEGYVAKNLFAERLHQELLRLQGEESPARLNITTSNHKNRREGIDVPKSHKMRTADEMIRFIAELVAIFNHEPQEKWGGKSRMDMFLENMNPNAPKVGELERLFLFATTREVSIRTNWIQFEEGKRKYEYLVPAEPIAQGLVDRKMLAKWDEDYPETILLCDMEGRFVTECQQINRHTMARLQMTEQDESWYGRQQQEKNRYMASMQAIAEDNDAMAEELDLVAGLEKFGQERRKHALEQQKAREMINHYMERYGQQPYEPEMVEVGQPQTDRKRKRNLLDL